MPRELRVLLVEDVEEEAALVIRELRKGDWSVVHRRVEDEQALREALGSATWDVVLSDFSLPTLNGFVAFDVVRSRQPELPFILVSGTIGEEAAVLALTLGINDYVLKHNLKRLNAAIERSMNDALDRKTRRIAEDALIASEARFRSLVMSMNDTVFTLSRDLRFTDVYGDVWTDRGILAEPTGKAIAEAFRPEVAAAFERASARACGGERVFFEWSVDGDAGARYFQTSLSRPSESDDASTGLVGVTRETTEHRRAETQLIVSDRMASVGSLAAGVAHEINNPLATVVANIELSIEDWTSLRDEFANQSASEDATRTIASVLEALRDAHEAANGVRQIVKDLKVFSRAGEEEHRGAVDLRRVIDSSARMAWNEVRHHARLVKNIDPDIPLVFGNESRLGQVFLNLLINAAQAIPEGRASTNEIVVSVRREDEKSVVVEVRDTGTGMSPDVLRRLFTPFFTTKPAGIGTGLGLPICHRIISSLGGSIDVSSVLGAGTKIRVVLPVSDSDAVVDSNSEGRVPVRPRKRGHVLVIDDEPLVGSAIRRTLERDHDMTVVTSAEEALSLLHVEGGSSSDADDGASPYDLILCDVMMPDMTGMDLYQALQRAGSPLCERIVFLTGGAFTPAARQFLDTVDNPRLEKPFDTVQLRDFVNRRMG